MDHTLLEKYAQLVIKTGINIQKNQILVITSPIECSYFARIVAEKAYLDGAKDVVIQWRDDLFAKIRYLHAPDEVFDQFPPWQRDFFQYYAWEGAAFLSISASDPEVFKDVKPERMAKAQKSSSHALKDYRERLMSNKNVWSIVSIPTTGWAQKVFPELQEADAVEKLWKAIFNIVRVDTPDPVAAWDDHKKNLTRYMDFLNQNRFRFLHYKNSLGTDVKIELPQGHLWLGGAEHSAEGIEFIANMPTEEVFTLPKRTGVNGRVVASKPLHYNGTIIERFSLKFQDGKIVDFQAEQGYEIVKKLIETDEGAQYLGEIALVPYDSPISKKNILFYNTLFDENASCHLALGKAYPVCIENGENLKADELQNLGVNDSLVHVDFMIGTSDLTITGITADGREVPVFVQGNFVLK